jgi:copper homeostasis protein
MSAQPGSPVAVEITIEGVDGVRAADEAGATRVELTCALDLGGLTPTPGSVEAALAARERVEVVAIVRPRAGDFAYDADERRVIVEDVAWLAAAGVDGVVVGGLTPAGELDAGLIEECVAAAGGLPVTVHRAIDLARDPVTSMDVLADLGVVRVLTSGGAATAAEGAPTLAAMVARAAGRVEVMAGSGVRPATVAAVLAAGVTAVHASARRSVPSTMAFQRTGVAMGASGGDTADAEYLRSVADPVAVAALVESVRVAGREVASPRRGGRARAPGGGLARGLG